MSQSAVVMFIKWFFVIAPVRILELGRNFLAWAWHFFSIGYFLPRIFSPWHKDITGYGRGFDLSRFLHVWGWNLISRIIGAVLRLVVMVFGLWVFGLIVILAAAIFVLWFVLPFGIAGLFLIGVITLLP